ncbi:hypothetical protein JHD50_09265 [Sulfurimonas sp. MAG313]|nr:hypothetical protein [Sulfurimonas sp. MAG313]MDF1881487.1 hypothetical protein [Sulfurimonas sp. MAG313]
MNLQFKELKTLFESGALKKCQVIENKDLLDQSFTMWFEDINKNQIGMRTQRSAESLKTFKNVQSAVNIANDIGFIEISLKLNKYNKKVKK